MPLQNIVHSKVRDIHIDERRTVIRICNADLQMPQINVRLVRVITFNNGEPIGNHWRTYSEIYGTLGGDVEALVEDIDLSERGRFTLVRGDSLYVPPRIALRLTGKPGTSVICLSEEEHRGSGTHKYYLE